MDGVYVWKKGNDMLGLSYEHAELEPTDLLTDVEEKLKLWK